MPLKGSFQRPSAPPLVGVAQSSSRELSLHDIVLVIRRRLRLILALVVLGPILALVVSLGMTKQYQSICSVEVTPQSSNPLDLESEAVSSALGQGDEVIETQVNIMQGSDLAATVISDLHLYNNPKFASADLNSMPKAENNVSPTDWQKNPRYRDALLDKFKKSLQVEKIAKSNIVEIRFRSPDPQLSAEIVNKLVAAYTERSFRVKYDTTMQSAKWLQEELSNLKNTAEDSQNHLAALQRKLGLISSSDESNLLETAQLGEVLRALTEAESDRIRAEVRYQVTSSGNADMITSLQQDTVLDGLRSQGADLASQLAVATQKYGKAYPKVIDLQHQLASVQGSIKSEIDRIAKIASNDLKAAKLREDELRRQLNEEKEAAYSYSADSVQYTILKHQAEATRDLYEDLSKKLNEAGVIAGLQSNNVTVVDKGKAASRPIRPNKVVNMAVGLGASLILSFIIIFLLESMDLSIRGPSDLEQITRLPVLAIIPEVESLLNQSQNARTSVITLDKPRSIAAEAYRTLRSNVLLTSVSGEPRLILVTSSVPGEGKSTTAINLAVTLAQKDSKVLLVDADLRRPTTHKRLHLTNDAGVSTLCFNHNLLLDAVVQPYPDVPSLHVLTAGPLPPYPSEMLASKRFLDLLQTLRETYDFIVIDSPPVLAVSDALVLSRQADATLIVVSAQRATARSLERAEEQLRNIGTVIGGIVMNHVRTSDLRYDAYYGYGYYGKYAGDYTEDEKDVSKSSKS